MKRALYWMCFFWKRLWKRPGFLLAVLCIPVCSVILSSGSMKRPVQIRAAVSTDDSEFAVELKDRLLDTEGAISFYECRDEEEMKKAVVTGRAECGYWLDAGLKEGLDGEDSKKLLRVYESPSSVVTGIANELVFAELTELYCPEEFENYMSQTLIVPGVQVETVKAEAGNAYETYRNNGSVFRFQFYGGDKALSQDGVIAMVPVRGLVAVMIFLCSLSALADYKRNLALHRFLYCRNILAVEAGSLLIPILFACAVSVAAIGLTPEWSGFAYEAGSMLLYGILLLGSAIVLGWLLPSEKWVAAAIPFAVVGSLIFSPVFLDLSSVIPGGRWVRWLIPVTYYLRLF